MFATVFGRLPAPPDAPDPEDALVESVRAQADAGIDLPSDAQPGGVGDAPPAHDLQAPDAVVARWRLASSATDRPVKSVLVGPYTSSVRSSESLEDATARIAGCVAALAEAGCALIEIDEPEAVRLPADPAEAAGFRDAHVRLASGVVVHLSLSLSGGNLDRAGSATFVDPPYASYALDLIAGPDNWRIARDVPGERGVVCGVLPAVEGSDDGPELPVWAAHYAASMHARGLDRVGLANAPDLSRLPWQVAIRKLARIAEAARIAALPRTGELAEALDPRATDLKSRALGRHVRKRRRG